MSLSTKLNFKKTKYLDQRTLFAIEHTLLINNSKKKIKLTLEIDKYTLSI